MKELVIIIKDDTKVKFLMEILSLMDFVEVKKRKAPVLIKAKKAAVMTFFNQLACSRIGKSVLHY